MNADFTVRPTSAADIAELIPFVKASWARTYDPIIGEAERRKTSDPKHVATLFEAEFASPHGVGMVARDNAGTVIGHTGGNIRDDGSVYVDRLHIDPAWKGRGVAVALMDAVAEACRGRADRIELTVLKGNERAFAFYRKYGFEDLGDAGPREGMGGVPAHLMRKPIAGVR